MSNELYFRTDKGIYCTDTARGCLGEGLMSRVFRVQREEEVFALKLLKEPSWERQFFQEVDWLINFMTAPSTYDLKVNGKGLAPRVYDEQRKGEDRFFVMDLAVGPPLDKTLSNSGGVLNELDALTVTEQLCRLYHFVHQELHSSYPDLRMSDVFWDDEAHQIMVIDWNLLSEKSQTDVADDLFSLGRLLYRMLTGVDVPSRGLGEAERWGEVSLGAQLILQRALHRNPAYRFKTAEEMRQSILLLLQRWSIGADQLVMQAGKSNNAYTSSADEVKKQESLEEAAVLLDLASRSSEAMSSQIRDVVYPTVKEEVDAAYDRSKPLEEGKHKIKLGQRLVSAIDYELAEEQFRRAYKEARDDDLRLEAARWMLIAEAGAAGSESFSKHEETYLKALALMQDQDYASVVELIDENVERAGGAGIVKLKREAQAWLAFEKAGQDSVRVRRENPIEPMRWQEVSDLYGEVLTLTQGLEYQDLLLEEWGDITSRQNPFRHRAAALREVAQVLVDAQGAENVVKELGQTIQAMELQLEATQLAVARVEQHKLDAEQELDEIKSRLKEQIRDGIQQLEEIRVTKNDELKDLQQQRSQLQQEIEDLKSGKAKLQLTSEVTLRQQKDISRLQEDNNTLNQALVEMQREKAARDAELRKSSSLPGGWKRLYEATKLARSLIINEAKTSVAEWGILETEAGNAGDTKLESEARQLKVFWCKWMNEQARSWHAAVNQFQAREYEEAVTGLWMLYQAGVQGNTKEGELYILLAQALERRVQGLNKRMNDRRYADRQYDDWQAMGDCVSKINEVYRDYRDYRKSRDVPEIQRAWINIGAIHNDWKRAYAAQGAA